MIALRPFSTLRGHDHDWLKARLHVAVAGLDNPEHATIGPLIAWKDDQIAPLSGFPLHSHQDVEIVTYVRDGAITHQDSLGNRGRTVASNQALVKGACRNCCSILPKSAHCLVGLLDGAI